jgi:hypothetical protein
VGGFLLRVFWVLHVWVFSFSFWWSLCILPVYVGAPYAFYNIFDLTYQKKSILSQFQVLALNVDSLCS